MGISLILIAVGAILAFAITTAVEGVAIATIGVILMAVGGLGLLISLMFLMSFSPWGRPPEDPYRADHHGHEPH
jgi:hypothetical protein